MAQLVVKAKKLNKRRIIPTFLPDPNNIVGLVNQNFIFEGEQVPVSVLPNAGLGEEAAIDTPLTNSWTKQSGAKNNHRPKGRTPY